MGALIVLGALAMAALFVRFRYRRPWWRVDVAASLVFVLAAVLVGTPAVGFVEALLTGLLFAAYFELFMLLAWALLSWVRRRVFDA